MSKYKFTGKTQTVFGVELKQIVAIADFNDVKSGDVGGWIESENNLSQSGNAWVFGDARVFDNAKVFGDAEVFDNAKVFGNARVFGDARVFGNARVSGDARVSGNVWVFGDARVSDNAKVFGDASVSDTRHVLVIGPVGSRDDFTTKSQLLNPFTKDE